ncbi:MAG: hypothetical protein ACRCZ2_02150 [Fusobacteriaceae bacterium]
MKKLLGLLILVGIFTACSGLKEVKEKHVVQNKELRAKQLAEKKELRDTTKFAIDEIRAEKKLTAKN